MAHYPITRDVFVYDADGIASIRSFNDTINLYLGDDSLDKLIDALQSVQADHQRRTQAITSLEEALESRTVSAVYSGRHGCACGCRGNHSSTSRSIKAVIRAMREAAKDGAVVIVGDSYIATETATRSYIAYTDGRVS